MMDHLLQESLGGYFIKLYKNTWCDQTAISVRKEPGRIQPKPLVSKLDAHLR
jgi:hypothetical protein